MVDSCEEVSAGSFVLAGGEGRRLNPLTHEVPKPLLPLGEEKQVIDFTVDASREGNLVTIISGCYAFESLRSYLSVKKGWDYLLRDKEVTGFGSLVEHAEIISHLEIDQLVVSPSDYVHYIDYLELISFHKRNEAIGTVVAIDPTDDPNHRVWVSGDSRVLTYECGNDSLRRKGERMHAIGIYCFDMEYLSHLLDQVRYESRDNFDITDAFRHLLTTNRAYAYRYRGHWRDIGTLDRYYEENIRLSDREENNILVGENNISLNSSIRNCVLLGNVSIASGVRLRQTIVDSGIEIPRSITIGEDIHEDRRRNIISTPKGRRVVSKGAKLKPLWRTKED